MLVAFHVRNAAGCLCGVLNPIHTIGRDWAARSLQDPCLCSDCVAVLQQERVSGNAGEGVGSVLSGSMLPQNVAV
jgi:hypothetical protein